MAAAENHHCAPVPPPLFGGRAAALLAPLLLLALTAGFYWKLVLTDQYTWLESPDMAHQVLPWLQLQAGEWHTRVFPMWDPYLWGGQSLIGQAQPGAAYPFNWILFLLPLRNGWIRLVYLHWYYVLIHFMAVLFAYWLARDLGCSRTASALAGLAFGLGGCVGTTDWPQMLNGAVWAPLVFLYLRRSLEGVRPLASAALSGMFLGIAWLSGHHQIPIYTTLAALAVWGFHILRSRRPDWKLARLAAIFLLFTLLAGALQILPAYEYGKLARRWVGVTEPVGWNQKVPYVVHAEYSFNPLSLVGIVIPGVHRHVVPFVGVVLTALALLGIAMCFRQRHVRILVGLAVGGLLFSLGPHNVFHGMIYAVVPLVEKARTPAMAIFVFHFAICMLAACGLDRVLAGEEARWTRRASLALLALACLLLAISVAALALEKQPGDRYALAALMALLAAGVIHARRLSHISARVAGVSLVGLLLIELGNVSGFVLPHRTEKDRSIYLSEMAQHADISEFLRSQPWPLRVAVSGADMPYNFGDWYGIDVFGGYVASLPENLLRLDIHSKRTRELMGVGYIIAAKPPREGARELFRGQAGLNVYQNPNALPRVWTVHALEQVSNDGHAASLREDANFDLRRKGWIHQTPPELEACEPERDVVGLLRRESHSLEIEARMACKGMVVISENYFPGWQATLDGAPARIYEVYTALRGVVVPAGAHRIQMRYRPQSVWWGAIGTLVGVAGACALRLWEGRRRRLIDSVRATPTELG